MTIAEPRAGDEGIFDMGFNTVRLIEDGGNPTLGVNVEPSLIGPLLSTVTELCSARRRARERPAAPLPIINTSQEKSGVVFIVFV